MLMTQKTVIVTGASQGIGAAVANLFLDRGSSACPASAGQAIFSTDQTNEDGVHDVLAIFFTVPLRVLHQWRLHHCEHR